VRAIVRYGVDRAEGGNPYVADALVRADGVLTLEAIAGVCADV
jgi:hypothetical protein